MANRKMSPLAWLGMAVGVAIVMMIILAGLGSSTYGGSFGMMGSGSWGWAALMMGIPAVILIVVLLAALGGLGEPAGHPSYAPLPENPLEILERRYARGELTRDDYLKIRDDLSRGPSHS